MKAQRPDWSGQLAVCIGSGPSLTADDCELVRASGARTIVTNTTFRMCPWADMLFAFDSNWWKQYHEEVNATFAGRKLSVAAAAINYGAEWTQGQGWFVSFHNSGACALWIAIASGARKVVMLGYDAGKSPTGATHWHGDHPKGLGNALSIDRWPAQFKVLQRRAGEMGVPIVNASRRTKLEMFKRQPLEEALQIESVRCG